MSKCSFSRQKTHKPLILPEVYARSCTAIPNKGWRHEKHSVFYNTYLKRDMHIFICFSNEIDRWLVSMRNWVQKLHLCAVSLRLFNDFPTFRHFFNTEANNSGNRTCKKYSRPKTRENLSTKTGQWRSCKWNCPFIVSSHELSWTCGFYKRTSGKLNWNYVNFVFRLCISYFSR